ncbi:uncharacterized protein LOC116345717 [Contarinia nasturtii]|uniref:uncharacterized protein LOC116345717 n=1 Tax=Contarinia nasturtii TaxID=265458 RepID=UPI0012D4C08D|nr:uncharacterized protein LOC116345717 [Contarinia nasturtii]
MRSFLFLALLSLSLSVEINCEGDVKLEDFLAQLYRRLPRLTSNLNFMLHVSNNIRQVKATCNTNENILLNANRKSAINNIPDSIKIKKKTLREFLNTKTESINADQQKISMIGAVEKWANSFDQEMSEIEEVSFMLQLSIQAAEKSLDSLSTLSGSGKAAQNIVETINSVESHLSELNQKLEKAKDNIQSYNKQRVEWVTFVTSPLDSAKPSKKLETSNSFNKSQSSKSAKTTKQGKK